MCVDGGCMVTEVSKSVWCVVRATMSNEQGCLMTPVSTFPAFSLYC